MTEDSRFAKMSSNDLAAFILKSRGKDATEALVESFLAKVPSRDVLLDIAGAVFSPPDPLFDGVFQAVATASARLKILRPMREEKKEQDIHRNAKTAVDFARFIKEFVTTSAKWTPPEEQGSAIAATAEAMAPVMISAEGLSRPRLKTCVRHLTWRIPGVLRVRREP